MKQTAGIVTALAVVLAIFGVSNMPKSSPGGGSSAQTESGTKASKTRPSVEPTGPYAPCVRIQKRLQPFVAESPQEQWKLPAFCYPESKAPDEPGGESERPRFCDCHRAESGSNAPAADV